MTGQWLALGTAVCWTTGAVCFERASRRIGSLPVNIIRLTMALLMLAAFDFFRLGRAVPTDAPARAWWLLSLSGFIGFFLGDLALFQAFLLIGARVSTLLMSLAPPIAALLGVIFLGERINLRGGFGIALTLAGIAWVVSERQPRAAEHSSHVARGVVLGIIAAIGQAVGLILGKAGMHLPGGGQLDPFASTFIRAAAGVAGFALLVVLSRQTSRVVVATRDGLSMRLMLVGAIAGPFLGVSLLLASAQRVPAGVAQTIAGIVPVMILPYAILVGGEKISTRAVGGAVVAVAGVGLLMWG